MLHYTRYSGTVALRGSGQGKGLDLHVEEAWTDMPQEPPSDMPHNTSREGRTLFAPWPIPGLFSVRP